MNPEVVCDMITLKEGVFVEKGDLWLAPMLLLVIWVLIFVAYRIFRNPFKYPYFICSFDITGKRKVEIEDYIDDFLRNKQNWERIQAHQLKVEKWKKETEENIENGRLHAYRIRQYAKVLDDRHAYQFRLVKKQTRYRQSNYVRHSYKVEVPVSVWTTTWPCLRERYKQLEAINFEATLRGYNSKSQRKLMTPQLRKAIMERDNYTCQCCGKYMPDGVGLQIDHIIPIVKGGKSVPSNLRVLCSKCNGSKGGR